MAVTVPFTPKFPAYNPVYSCGNDGPGASNLIYWLDIESRWAAHVRNLGVCACRDVRGGGALSIHARCGACDCGLKIIGGAANPIGDQILLFLLANASKLGIQCIIWNRMIYSAKSPRGTRYKGVHPHYDHLHIELTLAGRRGLTLATIRAVAVLAMIADIARPGVPRAGDASPPPPPPPPPPEEDGMFIVKVQLANHPFNDTTWEFFDSVIDTFDPANGAPTGKRPFRRMVPRAGGRADHITMGAAVRKTTPLVISGVKGNNQQTAMLNTFFERWADATSPADYAADGYQDWARAAEARLRREIAAIS